MNESLRSGLLRLAEYHAKAVADIEKLRRSVGNNLGDDLTAALAQAFAREEEARMALLKWKPDSNIEAQWKFLYVVHYLVRTKTSLGRQEMAEMTDSIAHLVKKERN